MKKMMVAVLLAFCGAAQAQTVMFSESNQVAKTIEKNIKAAKKTILVAMYQFTNFALAEALTNAAARHVDVMVVADKSEAVCSNSCIPMLTAALGTNRVFCIFGRDGKYSIMHNKFAVIDGKVVMTGSYNWTRRAETANWENFLVIGGVRVATIYANEFSMLTNAAARASNGKAYLEMGR